MRKLIINKIIDCIDINDIQDEKRTDVYCVMKSSTEGILEFNKGGQKFNEIKIQFQDLSRLKIYFDTDQQCCEEFGYMFSHDLTNLKEYIESNLEYVEFVDGEDLVAGTGSQTVFINFITSKGKLDLTVYNSHNGYYGHYVSMEYGKRI